MPWHQEEAFRVLLHKIASKATEERLAKAVDLALENDEAGVKYVSGRILKEMKQLKAQYKLRIFYAFSSIARASVAMYGSRSKYAARWGVKLETIAGLLNEIPPTDKILVGRVLQLWWRDGIFPPSALTKLQSQFPASPAPNSTPHTHSSGKPKIKKKKTHLASGVEKNSTYWDRDLGTEVVITRNERRDAPASPLRAVDAPAQDPSPVDESPLPESQGGVDDTTTAGAGASVDIYNGGEVNEDEEEMMPKVPKRRMITLDPNIKLNI